MFNLPFSQELLVWGGLWTTLLFLIPSERAFMWIQISYGTVRWIQAGWCVLMYFTVSFAFLDTHSYLWPTATNHSSTSFVYTCNVVSHWALLILMILVGVIKMLCCMRNSWRVLVSDNELSVLYMKHVYGYEKADDLRHWIASYQNTYKLPIDDMERELSIECKSDEPWLPHDHDRKRRACEWMDRHRAQVDEMRRLKLELVEKLSNMRWSTFSDDCADRLQEIPEAEVDLNPFLRLRLQWYQ